MPTDRITLADWQAMSSQELRAHIARGVMPPIMGADGAGEGGDPKEPEPQGDPAGDDPKTPAASGPTQADIDKLTEALRKEREKSGDLDKQVKELKPKADAHDQLTAEQQTELEKAQSELEKSNDRNAQLQAQIREANLASALADQKYGLASPQLASLAIKNAGIEFDDANQPKDLDDAVKRAVEANPLLEGTAPKPKAPKTNGGDGAGGGKETEVELTSDELAAAQAADMTPEEYATYKSPNPPEPSQ